MGRRAPWWAYSVPILVFNYLRQILLPPAEVGDAVSVALFAGVTAAVIVLVTLAHGLLSPTDHEGRK